jgi:microcystin-dependent protein
LQLTGRLNELAAIPQGLIAMWSGSVDNLPAGWALCNGLNATPNLSGKFIVGFNLQDEDYDETGKTGGQAKVALSLEQIPSHKHESVFKKAGVDDTDTPNYGALVTDDSAGAYYNTDSQPAGEGQAHENRPPYYVLAYIIKL